MLQHENPRGLSNRYIINGKGLTREWSIDDPHGVISRTQPAGLIQDHLRRKLGPGSVQGFLGATVKLDGEETTRRPDGTVQLDVVPCRGLSINNPEQ